MPKQNLQISILIVFEDWNSPQPTIFSKVQLEGITKYADFKTVALAILVSVLIVADP